MVVKKASSKTTKKSKSKKLTAAQKKALLKKQKKAELERKTKEALKAVDKLVKDLRKSITKDFGSIKVHYRQGDIVKKMRREAAAGLRKIALALEGKKAKK